MHVYREQYGENGNKTYQCLIRKDQEVHADLLVRWGLKHTDSVVSVITMIHSDTFIAISMSFEL